MAEFLDRFAKRALDVWLGVEAGPSQPPCMLCGRDKTKVYRCSECFHPPTLCTECTISSHGSNPLHIVQEWDAEHQFWVRRSLGHLGMVLELGHGGARCPKTLATTRKMTVVHEHGVWPMNVRFCGCPEGDGAPNPDAYQLLGAGLWPASWKQPLTAFSMSVMREFHLLSVQANTNAYDYFRYLQRTTDNITPDETKVSSIYLIAWGASHKYWCDRTAIANS